MRVHGGRRRQAAETRIDQNGRFISQNESWRPAILETKVEGMATNPTPVIAVNGRNEDSRRTADGTSCPAAGRWKQPERGRRPAAPSRRPSPRPAAPPRRAGTRRPRPPPGPGALARARPSRPTTRISGAWARRGGQGDPSRPCHPSHPSHLSHPSHPSLPSHPGHPGLSGRTSHTHNNRPKVRVTGRAGRGRGADPGVPTTTKAIKNLQLTTRSYRKLAAGTNRPRRGPGAARGRPGQRKRLKTWRLPREAMENLPLLFEGKKYLEQVGRGADPAPRGPRGRRGIRPADDSETPAAARVTARVPAPRPPARWRDADHTRWATAAASLPFL